MALGPEVALEVGLMELVVEALLTPHWGADAMAEEEVEVEAGHLARKAQRCGPCGASSAALKRTT